MNKNYDVFLDGIQIGRTGLEKADAPMGVVFGDIMLHDISSGYDFFKSYCLANGIEIIIDYPEDEFIATSDIPKMIIVNSNGVEIKGEGISISGMNSDVFEVAILGIPYPFYDEEFPHHVQAYNKLFK